MCVQPAAPKADWIVRDVTLVSEHAGGTRLEKLPPTVAELKAVSLIASTDDPYQYFTEDERVTATWLAARGLVGIRSVRERDRPGEPTPDAVFDHGAGVVTLELKSPEAPTSEAVYRGIRHGRVQSRMIVIDGRRIGTPIDLAASGLRRAVRIYGVNVDQVIVVTADESAIGWKA